MAAQVQQAEQQQQQQQHEAVDQVLPPYFPLKLKKCTVPAETFFACFETESVHNGNPDAARDSLAKCSEHLKAYKECMDKFVGPKAASTKAPASAATWASWLWPWPAR
ncbi:hypothetical protein BC831DRAFT_478013 [Entophlyctis helioformis]|nr:hypothetical protein BC831DRAFT_478013 [Entophlyctis helioformis]